MQKKVMDLKFEDLTVDNLPDLAEFYDLRPNRTADSVLLESYIWKDYYHSRAAVLKDGGRTVGLLWLYDRDGEYFAGMPLCREEDLRTCFEAQEAYFNEVLGAPYVIRLADEEAVKALSLAPESYEVTEEANLKDYLYDGEAMRTLAGRKLHKKKNHYNSFLKSFEGRWEYRALGPGDRADIFRFLDAWRETKGTEVEEHLDPEVNGIHEILKNLEKLTMVRIGGIFIDGKLEAFSIGSLNSFENMAVIHIEKANPEINGLYQAINREFLVHAFPEVVLVNREDDLGLPGLRKAKESYYPCDYAHKYGVRQKGTAYGTRA